MCEIIHWISFPFRTCTMMRMLGYDSVHYRVAEVHVGGCHVDFRPQYHRAVRHFAAVHFFEQAQVFFNGTIAVRAFFPFFGRRAFLARDFFRALLVHVCLPVLYQLDCQVPKLLEIIRSVIYVSPLESEPVYVFLYGIDILDIFLCRIGVVKTEIAHAAEFFRRSEIHTHGLCMSDMQITVRLGRETGLQPSVVRSFRQILGDYVFYEIIRLYVHCSVTFCPVVRLLVSRKILLISPFVKFSGN